jgi:hypothetical protein
VSTPEQVGKVATSAIDALKASPALLVLVLLQMAILGVLYFATQANQQRAYAREMAMLERCFPLNQEKK